MSGALPAVLPPTEASLGPAMKALNERMRTFVAALFTLGNQRGSAPKAYKMAGYGGDSEQAISVAAYRLKRDPRVQEAMREYWQQHMRADLIPDIHRAIKDGLRDMDIEVRQKAAKTAAQMVGLMQPQKIEVTHKGQSRTEMIQEIQAFARELGLRPEQLIGGAGAFVPKIELKSEPIDVEAEEVWEAVP
jgi:hypothetical protein